MLTLRKKLRTIAVNNGLHTLRLLVILAIFAPQKTMAQDSCNVQVSLLTCSPGTELYSIFGHSALRIKDSKTGTDIVYNYGTFDFNDPDFYSKFVSGKLLYFLSQNDYRDFVYSYGLEGRSMAEQFLNLACNQKASLQRFIFENMQEENRYYRYDFLFDNCTTRLRDIIERFQDPSLKTATIHQEGSTFREAIHIYLDRGQMPWSKLGIDLLLGAPIDRPMSNREAMFLPELLEIGIDSTRNAAQQLVTHKQFPVDLPQQIKKQHYLTQPFTIFSILTIIVIGLSFLLAKKGRAFLHVFDLVFFTTIGLLGCLLLFMWIGTDHRQTVNNLNLLWAWPTHLLIPFLGAASARLKNAYIRSYLFFSLVVLVLWFVLPQQLNPSIIPLIILAAFRGWMTTNGHGTKATTRKTSA